MTLRHLEIFEKVCQNLSITATAEKMNMTQPAVSIAIKELEEYFNTKLFDRANRKLYITEAGTLLRTYAQNILSELSELETVIRDQSGLKKCRLGVNVTVAESIIPELIAKIYEHIPNVELTINCDNNMGIKQKIDGNEIDIAILDIVQEGNEYVSYLLESQDMCLACSSDFYEQDEIEYDELKNKKLLLREHGAGCRTCIDAVFEKNGEEAVAFVESTSTLSLIRAARAGYGFVVIPEILTTVFGLKSVKIKNERLIRNYYVMHKKNKFMTGTMLKLLDLIKELSKNLDKLKVENRNQNSIII